MKNYNYPTPFLVMDIATLEKTLRTFGTYFEPENIYYAVKANSTKSVLNCVKEHGCSFDAASIYEIEKLISLGIESDRINYGNTIKKAKDIAAAYRLGVDKFTTDSLPDIMNIVENVPDAKVIIRVNMPDNMKSDWPLSRKFGCSEEEFTDIIRYAKDKDITLKGLSFHVGSQQTDVHSYENALKEVKGYIEIAKKYGVEFSLINAGGGMPAKTITSQLNLGEYLGTLKKSIDDFKDNYDGEIEFCIEPGRGMVGDAGTIYAEVVLIKYNDGYRWLYLDIGKFGGMIETLGESLKYNIEWENKSGDLVETVIAGPTCDSEDVLYEKYKYLLPDDIEIGDRLAFMSTGAYTRDYCAICFNGFPPLRQYIEMADGEIFEEK